MRRAHALAECSLRNSAWHHMRNISLIDGCFDRMVYGRQQERENIRKTKERQITLQKRRAEYERKHFILSLSGS